MEFSRGPPGVRGPPFPQIRAQRVAGNNGPHPAQIVHPPPPQQRFIPPPGMNQPPWPGHEDGVNYAPPSYTPDGTPIYNYTFPPQNLPSQEIMNNNPQAGFCYPSVYLPPRPMYHPVDPALWTSNAMMQPQPAMAPNEMPPQKKYHYNSKDNILICSGCGHKNILCEIEINKRDELIVALEKDNHVLKTKVTDLNAEVDALKSKFGILQDKKPQVAEATADLNIIADDQNVKPVLENGNNAPKKLSPTAAEFTPTEFNASNQALTASDQVPVVSAKGVMDEDKESVAPVLEIDAETQVEENLFEKIPELAASDQEDPPKEDLPKEVTSTNWNDELDAKEELENQVNAESAMMNVTDTEGEERPPSVASEQNWRDGSSQPSQWQMSKKRQHQRGPRGGGGNNWHQPSGYGRGRRTQHDQEPYEKRGYNENYRHGPNDNYRQLDGQRPQHMDNFRNNFSQPPQRNYPQRFRSQDDPMKDQRSNESRNMSSTRFGNRNQSGERENRSTDRSFPERNAEGQNDGEPKFLLTRDSRTHEDSRDRSQGPYAKRTNQNQGKPSIPNVVKIVTGDLFTAPDDHALAHCVAQDFRMGAGIAVKFKLEYKRVGELLDQNEPVGGCAHLKVDNRYIFYLVTKAFSDGKPTYETLQSSLKVMKDKCLQFGVKKLAMPKIGSGLDKLEWFRVKNHINEVFYDANMEIVIYDYDKEADANSKPEAAKLRVKYNSEMELVTIEKGTALLFLGTENGYMDPTAKSLDIKHRFQQAYKKAEKTVGNVVCLKASDDYIYALIVSKTEKDKIKFSNLETCCVQLSKLLRKDKYEYVGIESPRGWSTENSFFEKILTLLRNHLPKAIELWACFPHLELDSNKPQGKKQN